MLRRRFDRFRALRVRVRSDRHRQPDREQPIKTLRGHRLADVIVHAGRQTAAPVLVKGAGGHRQNRQRGLAGQAADGFGGLHAAHDRHLHVHQHQGPIGGLNLRHRFPAVAGHLNGQTGVFQQRPGHFLVDRIILDQQHPHAPIAPRQQLLHGNGGRGRVAVLRRFRHFAQPGGHPEGAAGTEGADHSYLAAHQPRQPPADRQSQAGPAIVSRRGVIRLDKGFEQPRLLRWRQADALIFHLKPQQHAIARFRVEAGADRDRAAFGKFDGVSDEVQQNLPQPQQIAAQPRRHVGIDGLDQAQPLGGRPLAEQAEGVIDDLHQPELGFLQQQPTGLDLGQIQDVVENPQQMLGGVVDLEQGSPLLGRVDFLAEQIGQPDDRVHRRADFVAHVGQKRALGPIGRFGRVLGLQQGRLLALAVQTKPEAAREFGQNRRKQHFRLPRRLLQILRGKQQDVAHVRQD